MPTLTKDTALATARDTVKEIVRTYFKDDYAEPFEMTDGQADIFLEIFLRRHDRVQVMTSTQYGKSTVIALAIIIVTYFFKRPVMVLAPTEDKAAIIMEKVIQHTFDHDELTQALELDPTQTLDRLKRSRSRDKIDWKGGGGVRILTANAKNRKAVKEALTGFGGSDIIIDEAALLPDDVMAMVLRMLGGHTTIGQGAWLMKIGNAMYPNHFKRSHLSPRYHHITIDYKQAIKEGRLSEAFIEEVRNEPFFNELYACEFPDDSAILEGGYRRLVTDATIGNAMRYDTALPEPEGKPRLGVDVAGGGNDWTKYYLRYDNLARRIHQNKDPDLMSQVGRIKRYMEQYEVQARDVTIDDNAIGQGIADRLAEDDIQVNRFRGGERADEDKKYVNRRAAAHWRCAKWLEEGGIVEHNDDLPRDYLNILFKEDSSSRLKLEPKLDMLKRGVKSPDDADALAMTFDGGEQVTVDDMAFSSRHNILMQKRATTWAC